jgi:UDP-GlcNAc:undecaprenyl-phosphate/decaprenyl-phosphate GlcNAc-1-phosphate transferase
MDYILYFLLALLISKLITPLVIQLATNYGYLDIPRPPRNLHKQPVAKLGGIPIFIAIIVSGAVLWLSGGIDFAIIPQKFILAILFGGLVLMIGGVIDDKYDLPAKYLWIFPVIASLIVVMSGIGVGIKFLSNPFGDPISLNFHILGLSGSGIFIFLWLVGMMFTTKFLDGLDGLVAGIGVIAGLTLFALSLTERVNQPITATLAIILVGSLAGYLIYAFNPAKIFLAEGGSTLVGFMLGVLSVVLGGKIATALLVMGIPILDVAWVIAQRIWNGKSPFVGDRLHIHFRLLDMGFSQKQTALILYAISAVFGFTAVFLQSMGKLVALGILFGLMAFIIAWVIRSYNKKVIQP